MKISLKHQDGFSLIELLAVLAILSIIAAIAVPKVFASIENARITADQTSVRTLNNVTAGFRMFSVSSQPFEDETKSNVELLQTLVDEGFLGAMVEPQSKEAEFTWVFEDEKWYLMFEDSFYVITLDDGFSLTDYGRLSGSYSGESKDIVIPITLDGIIVKEIYQKAFQSKGMVAVSFDAGSQVAQIHNSAFDNNNLTYIHFPDALKRIDGSAFRNNDLVEIQFPPNLLLIEQRAFNGNDLERIELPPNLHTIGIKAFDDNDLKRITIGSAVTTIGEEAFGEYTAQFIGAYQIGGAGTYSLIGGVWVKS